MKTHKIGIVGGSGFTGGELIRLLVQHPLVELAFVTSRTHAGKHLHAVHTDLYGETDLVFEKNARDADVIFLCLPHGESKTWMLKNKPADHMYVIDLSNDFRLPAQHANKFVYGLPELNRKEISNARWIANPGCFATAIQLGLLPLVKSGYIGSCYTTAVTGSTGAGNALVESGSFSWRNNNISAYKTLTHQHLDEMKTHGLKNGEKETAIHFVPWRGNFTRGIYQSTIFHSDMNPDDLNKLYAEYYNKEPFVQVSMEPIHLKQVVNTNKCIVHLEKTGNTCVVHSAIDNLLKGAAGQAVQNMNILLHLDETTGLKLKPNVF